VKIAPTLQGLLREPVKGVPMFAAYHGREAARELRALLACADALRRLTTVGGCGLDVCGTYFDEKCPAMNRARRALSRLSAPPRRARAAKGARP
jgi:hypothetical protein